MNSIKLTRKQAMPIIKVAAPDYTGRKIKICFADHVTLHDLNWGGGTRSKYTLLDEVRGIGRFAVGAPWDRDNPEGQRIDLAPGTLVVQHSIFCGADMGLTIWAAPGYQPKWLTATA